MSHRQQKLLLLPQALKSWSEGGPPIRVASSVCHKPSSTMSGSDVQGCQTPGGLSFIIYETKIFNL